MQRQLEIVSPTCRKRAACKTIERVIREIDQTRLRPTKPLWPKFLVASLSQTFVVSTMGAKKAVKSEHGTQITIPQCMGGNANQAGSPAGSEVAESPAANPNTQSEKALGPHKADISWLVTDKPRSICLGTWGGAYPHNIVHRRFRVVFFAHGFKHSSVPVGFWNLDVLVEGRRAPSD